MKDADAVTGAQNHYPVRLCWGQFLARCCGTGLSDSVLDLPASSQHSPQTGTCMLQTPAMTSFYCSETFPPPRAESSGIPRAQGKSPGGQRGAEGRTGTTYLKGQVQGKRESTNSVGGTSSSGSHKSILRMGQHPGDELTWGLAIRSTDAAAWSPVFPTWGGAGTGETR